MIFLADDPEAIAERRRNDTTRNRPLLSVGKLRLIQDEACEHAVAICQTLGIPLYIYPPDGAALIACALQRQGIGAK